MIQHGSNGICKNKGKKLQQPKIEQTTQGNQTQYIGTEKSDTRKQEIHHNFYNLSPQ